MSKTTVSWLLTVGAPEGAAEEAEEMGSLLEQAVQGG